MGDRAAFRCTDLPTFATAKGMTQSFAFYTVTMIKCVRSSVLTVVSQRARIAPAVSWDD